MRVLRWLKILLAVATIGMAAAYFFYWIGASMLWQAFWAGRPGP